jgi:hypothetical protein
MTSFRVEFELPAQLAAGFAQLVSDFGSLSGARLDLGDTGDARLAQAIEHFFDRSKSGISELSDQFDQLQRVLTATLQGYQSAESHVVSEIDAEISSVTGAIDGSIAGD